MLNYYKNSFFLFLKSEFGENGGDSGWECKPKENPKNKRIQYVLGGDEDLVEKDQNSKELYKLLNRDERLELFMHGKIKIEGNVIYISGRNFNIGEINSSERNGYELVVKTKTCGELKINTKTGKIVLDLKTLKLGIGEKDDLQVPGELSKILKDSFGIEVGYRSDGLMKFVSISDKDKLKDSNYLLNFDLDTKGFENIKYENGILTFDVVNFGTIPKDKVEIYKKNDKVVIKINGKIDEKEK